MNGADVTENVVMMQFFEWYTLADQKHWQRMYTSIQNHQLTQYRTEGADTCAGRERDKGSVDTPTHEGPESKGCWLWYLRLGTCFMASIVVNDDGDGDDVVILWLLTV